MNMAREAGFQFPPGHPQMGEVYKRHPLAHLPSARKENVYIPQDKYDDILMAERESELIKLLVHLGATRTTITRNKEANSHATMSGAVSAGAPVGSVGIEVSTAEKRANINSDKREFRLSGKPWKVDDSVDRTAFAWLHYEPSWEALVVAREVGGCTKAAIDIRENTTSSSDKALAAKVESALYGGKTLRMRGGAGTTKGCSRLSLSFLQSCQPRSSAMTHRITNDTKRDITLGCIRPGADGANARIADHTYPSLMSSSGKSLCPCASLANIESSLPN